MPKLGEIRKANELNRPGSFQYIWSACTGCGKERWVVAKKGIPRHLLCNSCAGPIREQRRERAPINLTSEARELIIGSTLGDTWIGLPSQKHSNPALMCGHKLDDIDYLMWKYDILRATGLIKWRISHRPSGLAFFNSIAHPVLWEFRNLFYPDGHKVISKEILNHVTPFALAVWHMDDGCFIYKPRNYARVELCTKGFTEEECQLVPPWLRNRYDVSSKVYKARDGFVVWITRMSEVQKFVDLVSPYILPCMMRKIGFGCKLEYVDRSELERSKAIQRWQRQDFRLKMAQVYRERTIKGRYKSSGRSIKHPQAPLSHLMLVP